MKALENMQQKLLPMIKGLYNWEYKAKHVETYFETYVDFHKLKHLYGFSVTTIYTYKTTSQSYGISVIAVV